MMNKLLERISIDPRICGDKPCIKGTRIWMSLVLDFLSDGVTETELLAEYPQLTQADIRASIAYEAEMARERVIPIAMNEVSSSIGQHRDSCMTGSATCLRYCQA